MGFKYIFSDLDGTLFNSNRKLSDKNREAIAKAQELGVTLIPCSGRMPNLMSEAYEQLGIDGRSDRYAICGNGALVCDCTGKMLIGKRFPIKTVAKVIEYSVKNNIGMQVSYEDGYNTINPEAIEKALGSKRIFSDRPVISPRELLRVALDRPIYKMQFIYSDRKYLFEILDDVKKITEDGIDGTSSASTVLEMSVKGQSKDSAMKAFCRHNNIDLKDVIAIGDNLNDIGMIKAAGVGACPSNAVKETKESADYISPYSNNEDAVCDIINKFILENNNV